MKIIENKKIRICKSKDYNYIFNKKTGDMARWGETEDDDPELSPVGPEILDMEISTICNGLGKPCKFCYKSNTSSGTYMTLEKFKSIFANLPKNIMQIAFGIGAGACLQC